jgi:hypothetical protein
MEWNWATLKLTDVYASYQPVPAGDSGENQFSGPQAG